MDVQPQQPPQPPVRKLYRSQNNRMVAGVCGGLAEYFNIDVTLIRVVFVVLAVFGATGLLLYLLMWAIVPDASNAPPTGG
jgi:phage shock protein C